MLRPAAASVMLGLLACAPSQPAAPPVPVARVAAVRGNPSLPGMDSLTGPLALVVRYPAEGAVVAARDSTFLFGSTGTGRATLTINGAPVKVWPNGAWLAWVPLPADSLMRFTAIAVSGGETASVTRTVRRPRRFVPPPAAAAWVDTTSLSPRGRVWWPADQWLPLALRASPGSSVSLWDGTALLAQLVPDPRLQQVDEGIRAFDRDTANLRRSAPADRYQGRIQPREHLPGDSSWILQVANGADTVRVAWPIELRRAETDLGLVELNDDPSGTGTTDGITVARALRGGTYTWFWPAGTHAWADARLGSDLRLALAPGIHAWVPAAEARVLPGVAAQQAVVGSLTLSSDSASVTLRIPLSARIPFQVIESERRLDLVLYGAVSDANWVRYGPADDSLVTAIAWSQDDPRGVRLSVSLSLPVWGYRVRYDHGDMLLEIHRPPVLDAGHPLRDLLVVVDPGHPPVGATGPTGLYEPVPNLGIGLKLRDLLVEAGARVVMTRTSDSAVDLYPRTRLADSIGADLLISIHNNALPDGVNPFTNNGTSVFYNHPRSIPLAKAVDAELVKALGVRDLGYARGDLALVRPTWMPAILTEGLFIMLPEQEAALRSDKGQELYAKGVYRGIEAFLKERRASSVKR